VAHITSTYPTSLHQYGGAGLDYQAKVEKIGGRLHMRCFGLLDEIRDGRKQPCFSTAVAPMPTKMPAVAANEVTGAAPLSPAVQLTRRLREGRTAAKRPSPIFP